MLGEERNGLFSSLNLVENLMDVGALADEVGSPHFHYLLLMRIFVVINDSFESIHID